MLQELFFLTKQGQLSVGLVILFALVAFTGVSLMVGLVLRWAAKSEQRLE